MTSEFIEIQWSSATIDEARKVARRLVQERLVACAQITPWIESIYMWNHQLETVQESKVVLKTKRTHFDAVMRIILENSSYQISEITYKPIEGGNPAYVEWLQESTSNHSEQSSQPL